KEEYWRQKQCHLSFNREAHRKSLLVELHWALDFKRDNQKILPLLWKRVRANPRGERSIKLLSPEDTLFSLALHNRRLGKMFCLKYVCDMGLLLNKYKNELDWDYILQESRRGKMRAAMFFALSQLKLLDFPLPRAILRDLNVPAWQGKLVRYFMERQVFFPKEDFKKTYLTCHFLLYDNIWEPVKYILNIPREQFAKYYGLAPYTVKTAFFYYLRWLYIPLTGLLALIRTGARFIVRILRFAHYQKTTIEKRFSESSQNYFDKQTSFFETIGWSMWPFLKPGTKLIFKKIAPERLKIGDIILYHQDNQTICHRLVRKIYSEELSLYVRGDNSTSPAESVRDERIIGKAIGIIKEGRICSLTGTKQHLVNRCIVWAAPLLARVISVAKKSLPAGKNNGII
ncbi:MAG: nucleotidyltransferase family protein, partial [Candidatus Omnitrophota bacterium]